MEFRIGWARQKGFMMDFGSAITALKSGKRVSREGWNGKGMWLGLQSPDADSMMDLPYIYMRTVTGELVPWLASQTDVLSDDWDEVPAPELSADVELGS